jgi:hypothetical protein
MFLHRSTSAFKEELNQIAKMKPPLQLHKQTRSKKAFKQEESQVAANHHCLSSSKKASVSGCNTN